MLVWYIGFTISGIFCGWLFYFLYRKIVPKGISARFWREFALNVNGLLRGDQKEFWSYYGTIITSTLSYAGRQLLGIFVAILPPFLLMMTIWPSLQMQWNKGEPLVVYPNDTGYLVASSNLSNIESSDTESIKNKILAEDRSFVLVINAESKVSLECGLNNYILCPPDSLICPIMTTFGFKAIEVESELIGQLNALIIRASNDDFNPLWPYLNDLEFLFFLSLTISTIFFTFLRKGTDTNQVDKTVYDMNPIDYMLTMIAARYAKIMEKIGNWEWNIKKNHTKNIKVYRPIYVTGLARAGTTILLEVISKSDGIATHRYRDFPFIMAPIFWNSFTSLFSREQNPIERPHKDRIKITRESPDAFEEPIWQHFFPNLHDPTLLHQLEKDINNPRFESFYKEHIKKILYIRNGKRYLSKGNYNISRVLYISKIFPDSIFLIPIRHPFYHVDSLIRQHRLFQAYSENNPQVAEYLKAVGHYEFGAQRSPICLTLTGGKEIQTAWETGDDLLGYAIQWSQVYQYAVNIFKGNPDLKNRLLFLRYEDLCNNPYEELNKVMDFLDLKDRYLLLDASQKISPPSRGLDFSEVQLEICWNAVEEVASLFGYTMNFEEIKSFSQTSLL